MQKCQRALKEARGVRRRAPSSMSRPMSQPPDTGWLWLRLLASLLARCVGGDTPRGCAAAVNGGVIGTLTEVWSS